MSAYFFINYVNGLLPTGLAPAGSEVYIMATMMRQLAGIVVSQIGAL